ncbi:hypothetical protein E8E13_006101 [Curvularia kusanoi]|uniref:CorA-like transporter domain-containing protein n=1 Tax=Curvularia kusanoi TaxID=90978 RepID=A0A9P4TDD3_CURKU|nr:hypothetical protein E8E13_006101 [Curvularia kusanoi]
MHSSPDHGNLFYERFISNTNCFEDGKRPIQPIHIIDVPADIETRQPRGQTDLVKKACPDLETLQEHLQNPANAKFKLRLISINQKHSWSRLQVTRPMLEKIIVHHDIEPEFLEVPLCFFERATDEDQSFCVPITVTDCATTHRLFYTIRYAEYKGLPNEPWVLRQVGVYHKFDIASKQSLVILLNAVPDSKAYRRVLQAISTEFQMIEQEPLYLHELVHNSYFAYWKDYLNAYEKKLLPIADTTTATFINEPLRVTHDTLGKVRFLESRFLPLQAILSSFEEVLRELQDLNAILQSAGAVDPRSVRSALVRSRNVGRYCQGYARAALFLQQRSNNTATLLADTLGYRNQAVAQEQNGSMIVLTRSAVFITIITLVYLPWTLITGIFGMEFFQWNQETKNVDVSPEIWQFFVAATGTTVFTMLVYYLMAGFPRLRKHKQTNIQASETTASRRPTFTIEQPRRCSTDIEKNPQLLRRT